MSTVAPVKRAIVQAMRGHAPLVAAIRGGISEGMAPRKVRYPFIVFALVAAPLEHQFDGKQLHMLFDISAFAENPVDASNVNSLIADALDDQDLVVDGQTTLLCRRVAELPTGAERDSRGRRIFRVGSSYSVWTDL